MSTADPGTATKVSIIVSKGSLEGVYPALIMANGARAEGIDADLFFTFFGLDAVTRSRYRNLGLAAVGNPALHLPTVLGALPGVPRLLTRMMRRRMNGMDLPSVPEFLEMIAETGAGVYACKASVDLFGLGKDDLIDEVQGIITVGEFYTRAGLGRIVYT